MNIGKAIKRRREELDLSPALIAFCVGMDEDKLLAIEAGDPRIKISQAIDISKLLGCRLDELIQEAETYDAVCT